MEGREPPFLDEEAAVDGFTKGCFWDNILIDKRLFEIDKDEQKGPKPPQNALKSDGKKNFHFGDFRLPNLQKLGQLRMR